MSENGLKGKIKELEARVRSQDKQLSENLDKIENLEELIMELEESYYNQSDTSDASILKIRLKDLEIVNRDLKNKLSSSKLENVQLKQKLEKVKKGQLINASLIQVVDDNKISKLGSSVTGEVKTKENEVSQKEQFKEILIKCPECETQKNLKIPVKIISKNYQITTLSIPKGMVCDHKFQVFFDKSLTVKRYQVVDFDFPHLEYYESKILEDSENLTEFAHLPFFQDIITILRSNVDDREILGAAVFTPKGKVIYASIPPDILFNVIKEFEVRNEKQMQEIDKMFLELKNHQKVCSEFIEVQKTEFILVLILSRKVNFGMASMLFRNIKKKIKTLNVKS
ncbi:MAG: hypothetical protein ACW986_09530 [Promethearchaeota archaeon]|jgi:hypothetical protein